MPEETTEEAPAERGDTLGTAVAILFHRGETEIVELLVAVEDYNCRWLYDDGGRDYYDASLLVDISVLDSFTPEVCEKIQETWNIASIAANEGIESVRAVPALVTGDWRTRYKAALQTPRNQASLKPLPDLHPRADQMGFRDAAELRVYEALKRAQERLPEGERVTIAANPVVRIPGKTREPDFLVAYRGRVGMIEVDGASHRQKWSNDKSRDQLFEDAGIFIVRHFEAEFTDDARQVDEFIDRFLRKLGER
jgi:hypothetical protein